jgi:tetratricopeptide (TPR) repeat protein
LEVDKILLLLKEEMVHHNILLIFDDFHKARDKVADFVISLINALNSVKNIKFIILSRYMTPFYDQDKVLIRKSIAELEIEGLDFTSSTKILRKKGLPQKKYRSIYKVTSGNPLLLEIFERNRKSKRYIYEEIFTQLTPEEQKIMELLSTGRIPIPYNAFFINNGILPETIDLLIQKLVIKENPDGNYDTHEFIKEFFYKRLPPGIKMEYHEHFARYYRGQKELESQLESLYHYIKSLQYENAIELAIELGSNIIDQSLSEKFLVVLDELPEVEVPLPQWVNILILKARLCFSVGDWDGAIQHYQRAIEVGIEVGKEENVAMSYYEIGSIFEEREITEDALNNYEKSLEISKRIRNKNLKRDSKRGVVRLRMKIRNGL